MRSRERRLAVDTEALNDERKYESPTDDKFRSYDDRSIHKHLLPHEK